MKRRNFVGSSAAALALPAASANAPAKAAPKVMAKVMRYAFRIAETGFDPAKITDIYSRAVTAHIFEGLVGYDYLARPARIKPMLARELPEVSSDFRTWTFRIREGVFFADDPAFKGKRRELVAEDFAYSLKRTADPATVSPSWDEIGEMGIVGLKEYRDGLRAGRDLFDYDHPIEGLRALDRYTLQIRLRETRPRFLQILAQQDLYGAVAREVIEAYADDTAGHPVGTGPYQLKEWRRSSFIALERNPGYRERYYEDEMQPAADDAEGQALLKKFRGRRLPLLDRVEVSIIQEDQPRWLAFLDGQFELLERTPESFITQALPGNQIAPNLARRGIQAYRVVASDSLYHIFNMEDPVIGGYTPAKVALRRAVGLALDCRREIGLVRRGQGIPAQGYLIPQTGGYDPQFKTEMSDYDPARARALLDLYGYLDRDGDGFRELPDGSPLLFESLTTPDQFQRALDELWQKNLAAVGLRVRFKTQQWPDNLKAVQAGSFQMWSIGATAAMFDAQDSMSAYYSGRIGSYNYARFRNAEIDAIFERTALMPDGPERAALFRQTERMAVAYMPYKYRLHRYITDLAQAPLKGYRRPPFWLNWWEYVDMEHSTA